MYVCSKLRLCNFLMQKGFKYDHTRPDINNPKYKVWVFKDSPELRVAIGEYYSSDYFKQGKADKESGDKLYVCIKMRLCSYLLSKGFEYVREDINLNNPKLKIWLFKDSEELRKAINGYYVELSKKDIQ